MKDKSLKKQAVNIKGKKYVLVADRVVYFNETYLNGCIQTKILKSEDRVEVIAKVIPDVKIPERYFTGHSQAVWGDGMVNKTAALENAETSAVGRALALMGIGVIESIASVDEIEKTKSNVGVCSTCGAEMKVSKTGNLYCPKIYSDPKHGGRVLDKSEKEFADQLNEL